ncbi:unnamed protein product [Knipowitschia caucasica]|uniref:Heat shock 70 kDa protein 12A n=1 Tax=Knipowitschia caucasica TaxID=637954 RepID=A0AAV2K0X7_KNICA
MVPQVKLWMKRLGVKTSKTPTCVLLDQDAQLQAFGYKAQEKFFKMKTGATDYYYFTDFKMSLYKKKITKGLMIHDVNKRPMSALTVFSAALRFLKDDALNTINTINKSNRTRFTAADFSWVLTVPAIWDNAARQFMRDAAVEAGIVSSSSEDKLLIALEPEAASVWCKQLPAKGFIRDGQERVQLQEGEQYVVLDCGGGTIDITVHEVLEGGALKELHKASGNNKGGRRVNKRFNQCLREFFCGGLWEDYEREFPKEAQTFVEDFIYQAAPQSCVYKTHIDRSLRQKLKRIEKSQEEGDSLFNPMEGVELEGDKLSVSEKKMESFFHESLVHITDSLYEILDSHSQIQYILLVGGFSQSRILCDHVRQQFSDRARVLCPKNPQEAILKGAVVFARDQAVIRSRKSAFTYGYVKMRRFDPRIHKPEKKLTNADGDWCDDLFGKLVEIGEDVGWNQSVEYILKPITENQTVMDFEFYRTERKSVTYVDEWGVEGPVACCTVAMPDTSKGMDRRVKLEVFFGSTEIRAKATDQESNCTASVKIDFIGK